MWNFRELTLAGKIQIFQSLALSKAVYVGTMTSPSRQFLDQLNLLKRNFIWDGKSTKIKHSTLIGCYAEGGYKDVDIESKFKSLKIIWIKRLLDDHFHPWKIIPNKLFAFTGMFSVFCQNFKPSRYCAKRFSCFPKFYQELILFSENVCIEQPKDFQDIINQSIWNNKFILREGDSIFYPSLHGKGLLFIRDLLDETGSFLNWSLVKEKFSLRNEDYMNWMSVIQSIPTAWRKEMKTSIVVISSYMNPPNYSLSHVSARSVYTKLIQPMFKPPTSQKTIEKLLNNYEVNWKQSYLIPQKATIDTSLRIFQYKILNNVLYLNERLSKIDPTVSSLCSLCKKGPENVIHLFCECSITKSLWHSLQKTFGSLLTRPALDPLISIVGRWDINNPDNVLVNHIVLLFKKFLYQNKSNPQRIHILALKHYIKLVERIEQKLAYDAHKLDTHFKKWEPVRVIF